MEAAWEQALPVGFHGSAFSWAWLRRRPCWAWELEGRMEQRHRNGSAERREQEMKAREWDILTSITIWAFTFCSYSLCHARHGNSWFFFKPQFKPEDNCVSWCRGNLGKDPKLNQVRTSTSLLSSSQVVIMSWDYGGLWWKEGAVIAAKNLHDGVSWERQFGAVWPGSCTHYYS